jgi:surface antigen
MQRNRYFLMLTIWLGLVTASSPVLGAPVGGSEGWAAADSFQNALEYNRSGTATSWRNPDTGHSGSTVPVRTFQAADGVYCREFQQTIIVDEQPQQGYGTACRQPDGSWRIVDPRIQRQAARQSAQVTQIQVYEQPRPDPYPLRYAYPYRYYPSYLSFSFGYVEHRGHSHVKSRHDRHDRHDRHWGHYRDGRRHHQRW